MFSSNTSAVTDVQLQMLGIDQMHADGFEGAGIVIALFDSGFPGVNLVPAFQSIFAGSQIKMTMDFITNSGNV